MTIRLTKAEVEEQYQETEKEELQFDPTDDLDNTLELNSSFVQKWLRRIDLREGINLNIAQIQHQERLIISLPETECNHVGCLFVLSGNQQVTVPSSSKKTWTEVGGQYRLNSTGSRSKYIADFNLKPWSTVRFDIHQSIFRSFAASPEGELPRHLQYLLKPTNQEIERSVQDIQPNIATVLQQILHCPYKGMVKRAYLESKVIELMAFVLNHEVTIKQGEAKQVLLKPEQIERIHYAKEILLRDLSNPPSLEELTRLAGLNEFLLRQGFRYCFDTTVFGILRERRLELAKQLLAEQDISVTEAAHRVGYASLPSFSQAFKRKFDISPKGHQKNCR